MYEGQCVTEYMEGDGQGKGIKGRGVSSDDV